MDERTKRLVERIEDLVTARPREKSGAIGRGYATLAEAEPDVLALCAAVRELEEARATLAKRAERAIEIAFGYGSIDGAHHKQWCMDQMLRALLDEQYEKRLAVENKANLEHDYGPWDPGVAP